MENHVQTMERLAEIDAEIRDIKCDVARILDKMVEMKELVKVSLEICAQGYQNCVKAYKDCEEAFDAIPDRVNQGVYRV